MFYGTGSDCPNVIDLHSGERRPGILQDVVEATTVCDALPNIDFLMSFCIANDLDPQTYDRHQMQAMLMHSIKPILFVTLDFGGCLDAIKMAEVVAGGGRFYRPRRCVPATYINVSSALRHNEETLALDVIRKIGPDRDFIGSKHTRKHFREDWYPQLFERRNYDGWKKAGGKTLRQRAQEKALEILEHHQPEPLPLDVQEKLDEIVAQAGPWS